MNTAPPAPARPPPDRNCLFVIGAARSGTTVLQNALNASPDIYLFGETRFHVDPGTPDFAARYNAMHRRWRNQETKSTYCPPLLEGDGDWGAQLRRLNREYRLVGAKIVIVALSWIEELAAFHRSRFTRSFHLFTFREPLATIASSQALERYTMGRTQSFKALIDNYLAVLHLFAEFAGALPNVRGICHEDVSPALFRRLQDWLGADLREAPGYYDGERIGSSIPPALQAEAAPWVEPLGSLYRSLRVALDGGLAAAAPAALAVVAAQAASLRRRIAD